MKGLGVKMLDKVLEIMEEEDDNKREVSETHAAPIVCFKEKEKKSEDQWKVVAVSLVFMCTMFCKLLWIT